MITFPKAIAKLIEIRIEDDKTTLDQILTARLDVSKRHYIKHSALMDAQGKRPAFYDDTKRGAIEALRCAFYGEMQLDLEDIRHYAKRFTELYLAINPVPESAEAYKEGALFLESLNKRLEALNG